MYQFAQNVMHFGRILRASGLAVGPDRIGVALEALAFTGVARRDDVQAALAAALTRSREDRPIFDEAFRLFWRDPDLQSKVRALLLPQAESRAGQQAPQLPHRRLAAAFFPHAANKPATPTGTQEIRFDAALTFSAEERLRRADFDSMGADEWAEAQRVIARLRLPLTPVKTRRYRGASHGGVVDLAGSLRASIRAGGDVWPIAKKRARTVAPPLVVLADVSGSMERYTRMLLHFLHAITAGNRRVETFLFGTRLTRISRELRQRDIDQAVARVEERVSDWGGGTRIGPCLRTFNFDWSRRVLAQRATVLLISDGLDRDDGGLLAAEMARLGRAAHTLIWLNPLLRYAGFEAKPAGIRAMLPHVDCFLPVHNIDSLTDLGRILAAAPRRQGTASWN